MELFFLVKWERLSENLIIFGTVEMKSQIGKPGQNILELYTVLVQVRFAASKRKLETRIINLLQKLPRELPNDLRIRILGISKY